MKKSEALKILGLSDGASEEDIKKAHRKKVIENHPDRFQDAAQKEQAEERTKLINEARDVLEKGTWDPEFGAGSYSRPYGNPYGNPYSNPYGGGAYGPQGNGQPQGNPFIDPDFWVKWEQASRGNSAGGQHTYDPFTNPFSAQQTPEETAARAKAVAQRDLRIGLSMLLVKTVICGTLVLQGAWLGAGVVWAILSFILVGINRLGAMRGCIWLFLLPLFIYFPTLIGLLMYSQNPLNIPVAVAVAIIFVWAVVYDLRDLTEAIRRWRVTCGKKSIGEQFAEKRRARKEARAKNKADK